MQFACESVEEIVIPSLSESSNAGYTQEIEETEVKGPSKPLKRKHCKNKGLNAKKLIFSSTPEKQSEDEPATDQNESNMGKNKSVGTVKSVKPFRRQRVERFLKLLHASEESVDPDVSREISKIKQAKRRHPKPNEMAAWFSSICEDQQKTVDQPFTIDYLIHRQVCDETVDLTDEKQNDISSVKCCDVEEKEDNAQQIETEIIEEPNLVVSKPNSIDINGKKIIVIESNSVIYLYGVVRIRVLRGAVEVLGYVLTSNGKSIDMYSPKGSSFLYVRALDTGDVVTGGTDTLFSQNEEMARFVEQQTYDSSLIICETLETSQITYIEKHIAQQIYPKPDNNSARYVFEKHPGEWNVLTTSFDWDSVCDSIAPHSKVFLCGGKGVGKSTFLRYAINKLLMKYKEIRVVDLDPGQPEFTVPGCVSLHTIREPVFGPNYTHIKKAEKCIFLPNVNIGYNPKEYIYAIQELLSSSASEELPTLINYMGFAQGIGLNIACTVIAKIVPSTVVQIQSSYTKKNFSKLLTPNCVTENLLLPVDVTAEELSYQFVTLMAMSDSCSGFTFQPRQIREMCSLAYISQILSDGVYSLTDPSLLVYKSNLQDIKLIANGAECHPAVVNACLVALCVEQNVYNDFTIYACHGWGVVRGIDPSANEIFLLTPESSETLETVTHLIYGSVNLPPSVYMTADDVNGTVPYVSLGTLTSFSSIPKRTHLPKQNKNK